ncbi:hypothetical protein [Kitasatospora griseola]
MSNQSAQALTDPETGPAPQQSPAPAAPAAVAPVASSVAHTRGGLPAVPLAVTAANTVVGLASAAALASGPLAALAATVGTVATGAIAARTARRATRSAAQRAAGQRAPHLSLVKSASPQRSSPSAGVPGQSRAAGGAGARRGGAVPPTGPASGPGPKSSPSSARTSPGGLGARVGEVRRIRAADRASMPSLAERRTGQSTARRQVADSRRAAKAAERDRRTTERSPAGRSLSKPGSTVRTSLDKARSKRRTKADERAERKVRDARLEARKAPLRRKAKRELLKSAARFQGRRLLAAALALPVGLVGMLTTPLGRKLGIPWLVHPGRRLYRHLLDQAAEARANRDHAIDTELHDSIEAIDTENEDGESKRVGKKVPRAPKNHTDKAAQGGTVSNESGFNFAEAAAEMYAEALNFDPDGMMQVLAAIESMPEGLESIANTFRVLAERSDEEFPLDKVVGEALNEVFTLIMQTVSAAEEVGKAFRNAHEADIARQEDPRAGEEMWDLSSNQ